MIMRGELPRNTGTDGDGVAQIEADTLKNARSVRSGSICAISPRSPSTSTMAPRLRFWKDRDRRPAKCLCTKQKAAGGGSAARRRCRG